MDPGPIGHFLTATLISTSTILFLETFSILACQYSSVGTILPSMDDWYNLTPVFDWIHCCIISVSLQFMIALLPLFIQELVRRGTGHPIIRLGKQFMFFSPVSDIFSTQIYTHSIISNLTFGGARYIVTGRGFASTRISFSSLFSRFAGPSIYLGMGTLTSLLYVTMAL
ncbi:glycosyl transferase [Suillus discolor]|uniref:Glycosyl transferase n=1 Tax=Suillus discolor TaxID=1912936 RepID=A0A9P7FMM4_9AGAM|nr:glycosyl transferase [Suillus discolor]KAG2120553.1 glycosyl transferase [Suillus discolor]